MPEKGPEIFGKNKYEAAKEVILDTYNYLASLTKGVVQFAEELTENVFLPLRVTKRVVKKGVEARKEINDALIRLKHLSEVLEKKGIIIKDADYYMAIALKESHFNPLAVSNLKKKEGESYKTVLNRRPNETDQQYKKRIGIHAFGAFQIKTDALRQVNMVFGTSYKLEDIFYVPKETGDLAEAQKEEKKLHKAMESNAIVAILYWHYCRDIAPAKGMGMYHAKLKFSNPVDQDRLAALIYNYGTGRGGTLIQAVKTYEAYKTGDPKKIKDPKTYKEFEKIVAQILAESVGMKSAPKRINGKSPAYSLYFKTYFGSKDRGRFHKDRRDKYDIYRPTRPKKRQHIEFFPKVVLDALDYSSVIHSIRKGYYFQGVETVSLAEYTEK